MGFLKSIQNIYSVSVPIITLLYPLYATVMAIESPTSVDGRQWLTYWVLYSFTTLFELIFYKSLQWLPFWPYLKLLGICWLVLPTFNGASYIYHKFVTELLIKKGDMKGKKAMNIDDGGDFSDSHDRDDD